jgi:hypothetical protein
MYLLFILINPLEGFFASYASYTFKDYVSEIGYLLLFTALTIESSIGTTQFLDRFLKWDENPIRRFVFHLLCQIALLVSLFAFFTKLASYFSPVVVSSEDELLMRQAVVLGILVSLIVTTFFTAEHFLLSWSRERIRVTLLEKKALEAELAALRTQIDPHFLFNNFSTLTALIEDDKEIALNYLEKLSSVYRYLLTFRNKNVASLFDESLFAYAYVYLYQVRYGKNLSVKMDIHPDSFPKKIPPLTLQLLLENAIKHNTISTNEPLEIKIYNLGQQSLIVENNLNPKTSKEESTGLGLSNIDQRYKLLGYQHGITVNPTPLTFQVIIPLIDDEN